MHPAPSLIVFTSLSGLGFGAMFFIGMGLGWVRFVSDPLVLFVAYAIAFGLAVAGLVASVFHLGHPERALLAFTQWRTSWLSREAVLASATLLVMGLFAGLNLFFGVYVPPLGWLGAALCLATIACTAMIYASLRAVPRWNSWTVPVLFLLYALAGGALLNALPVTAFFLLCTLGLFQIYHYLTGDRAFVESGTTLQTATGLGGGMRMTQPGRVRLFEPPHTGDNYLLREMVFRVGRRHRAILRLIGLVCAALLPALVLLLGLLWGIGPVGLSLALLFHIVGLLAARWLFYAEAEHVVGLYYGKLQFPDRH